MASDEFISNRLRNERLAAGMDEPKDLAARAGIEPALYTHIENGDVLPTAAELERIVTALGGIPAGRLYANGYLGVIGGLTRSADRERFRNGYTLSSLFHDLAERGRVLIARDEVTWWERQPGPNHRADVFMNLSCGTQMVPHLLLDTVAVMKKLDVNFVAAAGPAACCGKPFRTVGRTEVGERVSKALIRRSLGWGAKVHVNWCMACQTTATTAAARRLHEHGVEHPVRDVQVLTFLAEQVRALGDRVPWRKRISRRILVEGHPESSRFHVEAQQACATLLGLIPGVEVVDLYDGLSEESPCVGLAREEGWTPPAWYGRQDTAEGVREHRARLADVARSRGADTVSCGHQTCHLRWSRYASDSLTVQHAVSILADALDCAHPDRYQAAVRLGDPDAFVARTSAVWRSWGMTEDRARELAASISDPRFAEAPTECSTGGGCHERLIGAESLAAAARRTPSADSSPGG